MLWNSCLLSAGSMASGLSTMKTLFNVNLKISCLSWWSFQVRKRFWGANHFQLTKDSGSSDARTQISLKTCITVQCSIGVSATSVSELWPSLILLCSSDTGSTIRTVMTMMSQKLWSMTKLIHWSRLHPHFLAQCSAGIYKTRANRFPLN